jgi:hypothetical protein
MGSKMGGMNKGYSFGKAMPNESSPGDAADNKSKFGKLGENPSGKAPPSEKYLRTKRCKHTH